MVLGSSPVGYSKPKRFTRGRYTCYMEGWISRVHNHGFRLWVLTLPNALQRSRISSFSHQVLAMWEKPSEMLRQTKSVVFRCQRGMTQCGRARDDIHSFSALKPSINVNMLLVSENPAFARATLSRTSPMRSFKLKIESGLAASAEILAVTSGL